MADENAGDIAPADPAPRPQPLDYGTPAPSDSAAKVFAALGGGLVTIVLGALTGAGLYPYALGGVPSSAPEKVHWLTTSVFLALGVSGLAGAVLAWRRRPLPARAWALVGALIGLGMIGLLEGVCYANP